jgi:hypothetical protein
LWRWETRPASDPGVHNRDIVLPIDGHDASNQGGFPNVRKIGVHPETRPYIPTHPASRMTYHA